LWIWYLLAFVPRSSLSLRFMQVLGMGELQVILPFFPKGVAVKRIVELLF
tara:strand:+ start:1085 stop:1234 length:150 start_codon:yes stop_codon:yes gene_type:complete